MPAQEDYAADTQRGHLAEADAYVRQEQHDDPILVVLPLIEPTVLAPLVSIPNASSMTPDELACRGT